MDVMCDSLGGRGDVRGETVGGVVVVVIWGLGKREAAVHGQPGSHSLLRSALQRI